mgnify:FL=1
MKDIVIKKFFEIDKNLFDICYNETWQLCCKFDGINDHPNFLEDDFSFFTDKPCLYYAIDVSTDTPVGHLALYMEGDDTVEICLLIRPQYRNRGIARELFNLFLLDYKGYTVSLPVSSKNKSGIKIAKHFGFEYDSTEHLMELNLDDYSDISTSKITTKYSNQTFFAYATDMNVGVCKTEVIAKDVVCLYDIQIFAEYRGYGYGTEMLKAILKELSKTYSRAILHVSKENVIACNLYEKLGFRIVKSCTYYRYEVE